MREKNEGFNWACVMQSVAAEEAKDHAFGEREREAVWEKSWVERWECNGGFETGEGVLVGTVGLGLVRAEEAGAVPMGERWVDNKEMWWTES
jgi:hypothetical protein